MPLEKEIETYKQELPKLLEQQGKFVVIYGNRVNGIYPAYEDALKAGYENFGLNPFLVKKIEAVEETQFFGWELDLACHK